MNEVKVLIEGYAKQIKGGWIASSTTVLIRSNGKNIIVDPGCNRAKLLDSLKGENIKTADIDFVLLTHGHADHSLLAGIFEKAKIIDSEAVYSGDEQAFHNNKIPGTGIEIIQTPGHVPEHCSFVVKAKQGTVVIAGDAFWWMDGEEQRIDIGRKDPAHPCDMEKLVESRKKLLKIADFIIPGHGKIFKAKNFSGGQCIA